jgi:hypothetical protein
MADIDEYLDVYGSARNPGRMPGTGSHASAVFDAPESSIGESDYRHPENAPGGWPNRGIVANSERPFNEGG